MLVKMGKKKPKMSRINDKDTASHQFCIANTPHNDTQCHVKVEKRPLFMSKCHSPNSKGLIFEVGELGGQWGTFALVLEFA